MAEQDWLAGRFEQNREHLQAVAYHMLGTVSEAQDAVQEAWLRLERSDPGGIADLRGWLTTVVGRISLDMLRARKARREVYPGSWLPEPLVEDTAEDGPEHEAVLADSVGMALLVVLETLSPAERLSFVLHDVFAVPFDDVARIMDRTPDSARQLASRAPGPGHRAAVRAPGPAGAGQRRGRRAVRPARKADRGDRLHNRGRPRRRAEPDRRHRQAGAAGDSAVNSSHSRCGARPGDQRGRKIRP